MKNIFIYSIAFITFICCQGCSEDFIETKNRGEVSSESFWQTKKDVDLALAGIYDVLQKDFLFAERRPGDASIREWEAFTDNAMNGFLFQRFNTIKTGNLNATDGPAVLRPWKVLYKGIGRTNRFIANIDQVTELDTDEIQVYKAQAKTIRALMYFYLTLGWDDVPLITQPLSLEELNVPKNTADEIYAQIVSDLKEARDVLPTNWNAGEEGKLTKGAANALLAKVGLYFYGYGDKAEGLEIADEATQAIINSGQYDLFPDYETLFTPENEKNNEIIWSVIFQEDIGGNNSEGFSFSFLQQPQPHLLPLPNFINSFYAIDGLPIDESPLYDPEVYWENRDPRWDANIVYGGEKFLTDAPPFNPTPPNRRTGFAIDKYIISTNAGNFGNGGQDWYVFRYADVLLMRAEVLIEQGNTSHEVYDLINSVRRRVNMPTIEEAEGTGLSTSELTEILRHERRVELAFENTRFIDLKRWGTMQEAYERSMNDMKPGNTSPILTGVNFQGVKSVVLPLPQAEIDDIPALEQHPAW